MIDLFKRQPPELVLVSSVLLARAPIPRDRLENRPLETPDRRPSEQMKSLVDREIQLPRFMRRGGIGFILPFAGPRLENLRHELLDVAVRFKAWPEIESSAKLGFLRRAP